MRDRCCDKLRWPEDKKYLRIALRNRHAYAILLACNRCLHSTTILTLSLKRRRQSCLWLTR